MFNNVEIIFDLGECWSSMPAITQGRLSVICREWSREELNMLYGIVICKMSREQVEAYTNW